MHGVKPENFIAKYKQKYHWTPETRSSRYLQNINRRWFGETWLFQRKFGVKNEQNTQRLSLCWNFKVNSTISNNWQDCGLWPRQFVSECWKETQVRVFASRVFRSWLEFINYISNEKQRAKNALSTGFVDTDNNGSFVKEARRKRWKDTEEKTLKISSQRRNEFL